MAGVSIVISKKEQLMRVFVDKTPVATWKVSTARAGYKTPTGIFHPYSIQAMHFSQKYNKSPMPYSIFFKGGYAIHGTGAVGSLGRPASHGCVRLHPANAKKLYDLVKRNNLNATITVR
jgi:lipoprotein-anchoring transpeptidase ErfK/SrfK